MSRTLNNQVELDKYGNVVLTGTDIEVHRIAALVSAGVTVESVLQDYPSLTADQVAYCRSYAADHPHAGAPYPKLTAKAAMRAADLSTLDLED